MTAFTARRIRTMDAGRPLATAVAFKGGRIVSVGTLDTMKRWLEREEHAIDRTFEDKVIFPGFIDPLTPLQASGVLMGMTFIGPLDQHGPNGFDEGLASREAVLEKLTKAVAEDPESDSPVLAWGVDPALHGGQLHRDELDAVSSTRPIWTMTYAPHVVVANSPMLDIIGVDQRTKVPILRLIMASRRLFSPHQTRSIAVCLKASSQTCQMELFGSKASYALSMRLKKWPLPNASGDAGAGALLQIPRLRPVWLSSAGRRQ